MLYKQDSTNTNTDYKIVTEMQPKKVPRTEKLTAALLDLNLLSEKQKYPFKMVGEVCVMTSKHGRFLSWRHLHTQKKDLF